MMSSLDPSLAGFCIWPRLFTYSMLSTSMAVLPDPETQVVMCPPPPAVSITIISRR